MSYGLTFSFAQELFEGAHDFSADSFKVALYTAALDQTATAYTATNEVSGANYTAGGDAATITLARTDNYVTLTVTELVMQTPQAAVAFMLYNVTAANKAVLVAPLSGVTGAGEVTINWGVPMISLTV